MTKANEILRKYNRIKGLKLISAIIIDLVGLASYVLPAMGDIGDMVWSPISGLFILVLFPNRKKMAFWGMVEEMIPFTDFVPTAYLTWVLEYIKDDKKTLSRFVAKEVGDEQIVMEIMNTNKNGQSKFLE